MSDPTILQRLSTALLAASHARQLVADHKDDTTRVQLRAGRLLVVRNRGATGTRGDGVTAVYSRPGDGTFDLGEMLATDRFDVTASDGENTWTPEGSPSPTFNDAELVVHLLDRPLR
jgi:hypothetical protein